MGKQTENIFETHGLNHLAHKPKSFRSLTTLPLYMFGRFYVLLQLFDLHSCTYCSTLSCVLGAAYIVRTFSKYAPSALVAARMRSIGAHEDARAAARRREATEIQERERRRRLKNRKLAEETNDLRQTVSELEKQVCLCLLLFVFPLFLSELWQGFITA